MEQKPKPSKSSNGYTNSSINGDIKSVPNDFELRDDPFDDLEESLRCGYCSWKPDWLQKCNTPRWLLVCVCWFTFTQGFVVNGIIYVNLAPWERLYELKSQQTAWIVSTYDISAAVFTLLFGYVGQFTHNGLILAWSAFVMALGSFTMVLPHALSGLYELGPQPVQVCDISGNSTGIDCTDTDSSNYYWFLIAGQVLHGVGGAALYTLAIPYMDDQIKMKNLPVYMGIMLGFAALGPALGYVFGGLFLNIYVDVGRTDETIELEPDDPRWVGAWWIGLIYTGFTALTVAALMACFPKQLPSAKKYQAERKSQAHKGEADETAGEDFGKSARDVWITVKYIFTNPVWIFLTVAGTIESGAITGFAAFLPKVIQFQFLKSPSEAAVYAGLVVVPGAAGGQVLGGLIPKWLNLQIRGLIMQSFIVGVVGLLLSFQFLLRCKTPAIAGVTVPYFNSSMDPSYDTLESDVYHPCNEPCNCTTESYDPVCGSDDVQYFTPCFAGCTVTVEGNDDEVYTNCLCIEPDYNATMTSAEEGICQEDCDIFGLFMFLFLCINLCTFISATAGQAATIRCVPDKQRSFAFGVQRTIVRLLGNVPGPIIFGAVFDAACLVWQEVCGEEGSCWIYDTQFVAVGIFWACIVVKAISSISFLLAFLLYKAPPEGDGQKEAEEEDRQKEAEGESMSTASMDSDKGTGVENGGFSDNDKPLSTYL